MASNWQGVEELVHYSAEEPVVVGEAENDAVDVAAVSQFPIAATSN